MFGDISLLLEAENPTHERWCRSLAEPLQAEHTYGFKGKQPRLSSPAIYSPLPEFSPPEDLLYHR